MKMLPRKSKNCREPKVKDWIWFIFGEAGLCVRVSG